MKRIITQKDEQCGHCVCELPKGTTCYSDEFENLRCADCYEDEIQGETYG